MPFIKVKDISNKKYFVRQYKDREEAKADPVLLHESIIEVQNVEAYKKFIDEHNLSYERQLIGYKEEPAPKPVINDNINIDLISDKAKELIKKAWKEGRAENWMLLIDIHNEERWSSKVYCCPAQIDYFKVKIQKAGL